MPQKKWRAPESLRERVLTYTRRRRDQGETVSEIAGQVGMVESTLYRWLRRSESDQWRRVSQVAIVPTRDGDVVVAHEAQSQPLLRIITPRGYVVEGLGVEDAAMLLKAIG